VEAEFGGAMAAAARDKNNLSATIRTAWDGKTISPLVKNSKWAATNPHIVITGHITAVELIDRMKDVDAFSGFLNRFVILHVMRPKLVPLPKRTDDAEVERLAGLLADCAHFATGGNPQGNNLIEVTLSPDAIRYWCGIYKGLTKEAQGVSGALLVRTEIYCRMFAMVFALLDKSVLIEPVHIDAAMAWVDYWRASVDYIFETLAAKEEAKRLEGTASGVYGFIKLHPGCTRTDITNNFKNKLAAEEMAKALNYLLNASPPLIRQSELPRADGKPGRGVTKFKAL
jgi:putative DNA primase/helicase